MNVVGTSQIKIAHCLTEQHCNSNLASLNHWPDEYWMNRMLLLCNVSEQWESSVLY